MNKSANPVIKLEQLVIIDAAVADIPSLRSSLLGDAAVHILRADLDGIAQITELLAMQYQGLDNPIHLHIIGHGSPGCIKLGQTELSLDTLDHYQTELVIWKQAVSGIALYGCQVAAGDAGEEFLQKLRRLTDADVSASTQRVGHADQGGTWTLDWVAGRPLALPSDAAQLATYPGVLASDLSSTITDGKLSANKGDTLTYTVTFRNSGPDPIREFFFDVTSPPGLTNIQTGTPSTGSFVDSGFVGIRKWQRDTPLGANETFTVNVTGTIPQATTLSTFTAKADVYLSVSEAGVTRDNNPSNDESSDLTIVSNPAFDIIGVTALRNDSRFAGIDGTGITVAVMDTGVDNNNQLLQSNFREGVDFVSGTYGGDTGTHGTHVAGTVGAIDPNIGVAPKAGIVGLQVFENNRGATKVNDALKWVLANYERLNIRVLNMSLGGGVYNAASQTQNDEDFRLVKQLEQAGVTVVSAAGNDYAEITAKNRNDPSKWGVASPGIHSSLLVGAVWRDGVNQNASFGPGTDKTTGADRLAVFSQRLPAPNMLFAPGAKILSSVPVKGGNPNAVDFQSGTSMATPTVSGAIALLQQVAFEKAGRYYAPDEIVRVVFDTADKITDGDDEDNNVPVRTPNVQYPRINVLKAAETILQTAQQLGGNTMDANGTIQGAYLGPRLNANNNPAPIQGRIGFDGGDKINVGNTDVDLYRFEITQAGPVTIEVASSSTNAADFDSFLRLFDAQGNQLATDDNGGNGTFSKITNFNLTNPGVYYAGVSGVANNAYNPNQAGSGAAGATGNYQIQFSLASADPNGTTPGATVVTLGTPATINEVIGTDNGNPVTTVDDVDFYRFNPPDDGNLSIAISSNVAGLDPTVRLFRASDLADLGATSGVGPVKSTQGLNLTVPKGTELYLGVSRGTNVGYTPDTLNGRPAAGANGNYTLNLSFTPSNPNTTAPAPGSQNIISDSNGSVSLAEDLNVVPLPIVELEGAIGSDLNPITGQEQPTGSDDVDLIPITSPEAGLLFIEVLSQADPNNSDPVDTEILLLDSNGNLIALSGQTAADAAISKALDDGELSDEEVAALIDPSLLVPIQANTTYFLGVVGAGTEQNFDPDILGSGNATLESGRYKLTATVLPESDRGDFSDDLIGNKAVQTINIDDVQFGSIGDDSAGLLIIGPEDVDLYKFVPTFSGLVDIFTFTGTAYDTDSFLRVFDASGNELIFNDDADETTLSSAVTLNVAFGTTYYISVSGFSDQARNYNPVTGAGRAAADVLGEYDLAILPVNLPLPTVLNRLANDTFRLEGIPGTAQVQATVTGRTTQLLNELSVFTVDDDEGRINGLAPGDNGYLQAALERSQVVLSTLANLPNGTSGSPSRSLNLNVGSRLRFFLVKDGTADGVRSGRVSTSNIILSDPNALQVTQSGNTYTLAWEDTPGAGADFKDLVVTLNVSNQPKVLGTDIQGSREAELIDLRAVTGTVRADFTVTREAAFNNTVGFFAVQNTQGTIADPTTGNLLNPGDAGYLQTAVRSRISGIDLKVANQTTGSFTGQFAGGSLLAPFLILNGDEAALLDADSSNDPAVYVPFLGSNPGGVDHIRLLGDNTFGFEDVIGGGDFDYNDVVVQVNLQVI